MINWDWGEVQKRIPTIDWAQIQQLIPSIDWGQIEQLIPSLRDNPNANVPLTPEGKSALQDLIDRQITFDGQTNFITGQPLDRSKPINRVGPFAGGDGGGGGGAQGPGVPPMADWKQFVVWIGAIAVLWFVLTAAAESGFQSEAYAFAGLILVGALLFMGPNAIKHAQQLAPT